MVVVHHDLAHAPSPGSHRRDHLLCKRHRQRSNCLHGKSAGEAAPWIGLVKLFAQSVRRWRFIKTNEFFESAGYDIAGLSHQIFAECPAGICQTVPMTRTSGIEQQSRRLNRVAGDDDRTGSLKVLFTFAIEVDDAINPAIVAQTDASSHRMCADLGAVRDGIWHMCNESAGFGSDLASLEAKPAIDAMRSIAMRSGKNCDRTTGNGSDAEIRATAHQHVAYATKRMRTIRVTMRITPGKPCRASNRNLALQQFVIGLQVPIRHGPIGADTIFGVHAKIGRMKARCEGGPVNGTSSHSLAAVVRAERERMRFRL